MTHSWSLGEYKVAPGVFIQQYLFGGPVLKDKDNPNGGMVMQESISWSIINYDLRDKLRMDGKGRERFCYAGWMGQVSISEDQAITMLKLAGYSVKPGKAGLCRIDTVLVIAPDTNSWEVSKDFFPEASEVFDEDQKDE